MKLSLNRIRCIRALTLSLMMIGFSLSAFSAKQNFDDNQNPKTTPKIKLFPNPASQILNVQLPEDVKAAELSISNMFGQELLKTNIITGAIFAVNLDNLVDGIYLVSITTDGRTAKYKLVVRR